MVLMAEKPAFLLSRIYHLPVLTVTAMTLCAICYDIVRCYCTLSMVDRVSAKNIILHGYPPFYVSRNCDSGSEDNHLSCQFDEYATALPRYKVKLI